MTEIKKNWRKKGFTLVELLIVIIIIGIMAGGLMLSMTSSSDSANAATLISDLRNTKAAAIMWLADNIASGDVNLGAVWTGAAMPQIMADKYMDNRAKALDFSYKYSASGGFLIGKKNVPKGVATKAISQAGGFLLDEDGNALVSAVGALDIYILIK